MRHSLKASLDFDTLRLSKALSAVSGCLSNPDLSIIFTIKDVAAINDEMLRSATVNAERKPEILCASVSVSPGSLLSIDYNWGGPDITSSTRYEAVKECLAAPDSSTPIDITPDDTNVSDIVTFFWEII